ncbi:MAG: hypothetical protein RL732_1136 [Bacteroidota bacterium]
MRKIVPLFIVLTLLQTTGYAQPLIPFGPVPSAKQLQWQELEFYVFMHFGPNTFYDQEWGHGTEDPNVFNPTQLDCRQWARIAKDAGAKGIIITAKHHDGFCLWPSNYSTHTVRESSWQSGKGDVLRDLSAACKEYGLKFGIYISPWDRNHPQYGSPGYNDVYVNTMKEAVKTYGPIFEMWWDGANGEGPNGKKQVYDFVRFESAIKDVAPDAVVFSDIGPDIRWVGNEEGFAGETNWALLDTAGFSRGSGGPSQDTLNRGNVNGKNWIPAECDVSIRPGWFYHADQDSKVKSGNQLMDLYLRSVGRGANLLLNVPPDRRGLIHENDSASLMDFRTKREAFYAHPLAQGAKVKAAVTRKGTTPAALTDGLAATFWAAPEDALQPWVEIDLGSPQAFNTVVLEEAIQFGQRVSAFTVSAGDGKNANVIAQGTTIGHKRILQFPEQVSSRIRIQFTGFKAAPVIKGIGVYRSAVY